MINIILIIIIPVITIISIVIITIIININTTILPRYTLHHANPYIILRSRYTPLQTPTALHSGAGAIESINTTRTIKENV